MNNYLIEKQNELQIQGYTILDDFLLVNVAEKLNELYLMEKEENWEFWDQVRKDHYSHVFKTKNSLLPSKEEEYRAKFWRSENLESNPQVNKIIDDFFENSSNRV